MSSDVPVGPRIPRITSDISHAPVPASVQVPMQAQALSPALVDKSQSTASVVAPAIAASSAVVRSSFSMTSEHILIGIIIILVTVILMLIVYIVKIRGARAAPDASSPTPAPPPQRKALPVALQHDEQAHAQMQAQLAREAAALADLAQTTYIPRSQQHDDDAQPIGQDPRVQECEDVVPADEPAQEPEPEPAPSQEPPQPAPLTSDAMEQEEQAPIGPTRTSGGRGRGRRRPAQQSE